MIVPDAMAPASPGIEPQRPVQRPYSLKLRLITALLGASALLWVVSLCVIVSVAWWATSGVFDDALKEGAYLMMAASPESYRQGTPDNVTTIVAGRRVRLYYQVVVDDQVVRRAALSPQRPYVTRFEQHNGFRNVFIDGATWRVFVLRSRESNLEIQIGQPYSSRTRILRELAEDLVWPALLLLALLGIISWFAIQRLIKPIENTARAISLKSPADLTPVSTDNQPIELTPIVGALNSVLGRLANALEAERRFTADAAHELRTPLAALRMRIQLLQRQYPDQYAALHLLHDDADRCTALVENLLSLARLEPEFAGSLSKEHIALNLILSDLEHVYASTARAKRIHIDTDAQVETVWANAELLRSAIRNLLDNAFRYCPPGSRILIETRQIPGYIRVVVRDNGPGVPIEQRDQLAERFFRVLGSDEPGSGLGLSIVARIMAIHAGTLAFEEGLENQGLGVILDFPSPPDPAGKAP